MDYKLLWVFHCVVSGVHDADQGRAQGQRGLQSESRGCQDSPSVLLTEILAMTLDWTVPQLGSRSPNGEMQRTARGPASVRFSGHMGDFAVASSAVFGGFSVAPSGLTLLGLLSLVRSLCLAQISCPTSVKHVYWSQTSRFSFLSTPTDKVCSLFRDVIFKKTDYITRCNSSVEPQRDLVRNAGVMGIFGYFCRKRDDLLLYCQVF